MINIPVDELAVTDEQVFEAFNLDTPGMEAVKQALESHNLEQAKKALVRYFETRKNVRFLFDYRELPLKEIDPNECPYSFQSSLGLRGDLKKFCLFVGNNMMEHRYVLPGSGKKIIDLGADFENMIHFNFLEDQGKKHRHSLDMFVRGQFFESLCVLYHHTADKAVLECFAEILQKFFETYPLQITDTAPWANRFQYTEDRDVMSVGWLTVVYISLFYTRVPYETSPELSFEILKRIWFLGIQFRRFDNDSYRPYNHHMWERGLVPFILGTLLPEIPEFQAMKAHGAEVVCRHIEEDFNEDGGYNEHSIAYWSGAAVGEMLYRGVYLARLNNETLLTRAAADRLNHTFSILARISPSGNCYPSLGDNGGPLIDPILRLGVKMVGHSDCEELLRVRSGQLPSSRCTLPKDYCNDKTGFICGRSGYGENDHYFLMSVKNDCGYSGHNHMDMLSLFLNFRGQEMIGEPYTNQLYHTIRMGSDARGYMYNMESHNTVLAYGQPVAPNRVYANKWGVYRPDSPVTAATSYPDGMYVEAHHNAYTFCSHERKLLFHRQRGFLICDEVQRGNRLPEAHIQRWHLMPETACRQLGDSSVLLEKNGVRILCIWSGLSSLRIWKNQSLCPEIIPDSDGLYPIIDAAFIGPEDKKSDNITVSLKLLMLDITEDADLNRLLEETGAKISEVLEHLTKQLDEVAATLSASDSLEKFAGITP